MKKYIGVTLFLSFIPLLVSAQQANAVENVVFKYFVLPFSLFISALIISLLYANRDKGYDKLGLRVSGWILSIINAAIGIYWLFFSFYGIYYYLIGEPYMKLSAIMFLISFAIGGFIPFYIMFKADFRPQE